MRLFAGMVALLLAVGTAAADAEEKTASDRITVAELKKLVAADKVLVVDVRSVESYKTEHIAGSVSAPLVEIEKHLATLKAAKKPIVTYCT